MERDSGCGIVYLKRTDGVTLASSGDSAGNLELRPFSVRQIEGAVNQFETNGCGTVSLDSAEDLESEEIATAIDQIGLSEMVSYVLENFDDNLGEPSSDEEDYSLAINRVMEAINRVMEAGLVPQTLKPGWLQGGEESIALCSFQPVRRMINFAEAKNDPNGWGTRSTATVPEQRWGDTPADSHGSRGNHGTYGDQ